MNIAYSCNEAYIQHTGISMLSLLESNKHIPNITFFFIQKDVKDPSIEQLIILARNYEREIEIISFDSICFDLKINSLGRHIETIYSKLFFSRIEGVDKILYLDSDTIINGSLKELWEIDLENNLFAGVDAKAINSGNIINLGRSDPLINDGVVIVNVKELRKHDMLNKFKTYIDAYKGAPPLLSEGIINKLCIGKIKIIHPKYNLMSGLISFKGNRFANTDFYYTKDVIQEAIKSPVIIHYLAAFYNRPWDINCSHPMKDLYLYYKSISFWKNVALENKKLSFYLRIIKLLYTFLPHDILDFIRYIKENFQRKYNQVLY